MLNASPANIFPKTIARLYDLATEALATGNQQKMQEAVAMQDRGELLAIVLMRLMILCSI